MRRFGRGFFALAWCLALGSALTITAIGAPFNRAVLKNKTALVFATKNVQLGNKILAITRKYSTQYTLLRYTPVPTRAKAKVTTQYIGAMPLLVARQISRQLVVGGVVQPAPAPRFGRSAAGHPAPPSLPGADTDAVLAELGCTTAEIAALRARGAVG